MISSFIDLFTYLLNSVLKFTDILYLFFGFLTIGLVSATVSYLVKGKY